MDAARRARGIDRSSYIREALVEKLSGLGVDLPKRLAFSPDRVRYPVSEPQHAALNEVSSKPADAAKAVAVQAAASARKRKAK